MIPAGVKVFLSTEPCDMRRGFRGLTQIVAEKMAYDVASRALFVFFNGKRDRLKILWVDDSGTCVLYKHVRGRFRLPECIPPGATKLETDRQELELIFEGIATTRSVRRREVVRSARSSVLRAIASRGIQ